MRVGSMLSKKSKIEGRRVANGEFWTTPLLRCSVGLIRRSVVVFLRHEVPHVAAHECIIIYLASNDL